MEGSYYINLMSEENNKISLDDFSDVLAAISSCFFIKDQTRKGMLISASRWIHWLCRHG